MKMLSRRRELPAYHKKDIRSIHIEDTVVRADFLTIKNGTLGIRRRKYFKLLRSNVKNKNRLEIYSNREASVSKLPESIILSSDVANITIGVGAIVTVSILAKSAIMEVFADTNEGSVIWGKAMRETFLGPEDGSPDPHEAQDPGTFTEVSLTGNLRKVYGRDILFLQIKNSKVCLINEKEELLHTWPMKMIRNWGISKREFHFETGSNYPDGHQKYVFKTLKGGETQLEQSFKIESEKILKDKNKPSGSSISPAKTASFFFPPHVTEGCPFEAEPYDDVDDLYEDLYEEDGNSNTREPSPSPEKAMSITPEPPKNFPSAPTSSKNQKPNSNDPIKAASMEAYKSIVSELSLDRTSPVRLPAIVDGSLYTVVSKTSPEVKKRQSSTEEDTPLYSTVNK